MVSQFFSKQYLQLHSWVSSRWNSLLIIKWRSPFLIQSYLTNIYIFVKNIDWHHWSFVFHKTICIGISDEDISWALAYVSYWNKWKRQDPPQRRSQPKYSTRNYSRNKSNSQQKHLTGHKCVTTVSTSHRMLPTCKPKTASVNSGNKQDRTQLYSSLTTSITPTIKIPNKIGTLLPN